MSDTLKVTGLVSMSIKSNPRHQRVHRREQPGTLAVGRATMVMSGAKFIRQFHNLPVKLPPPPYSTVQQV